MSEKNNIKIRDFDLFVELVKSAVKIVPSAKFVVDQNGVYVYGASGREARCELVSNSLYADEEQTFSMLDLNGFLKVLTTIQTVHENDYSNFKFELVGPHVKFSSKKFKTKLNTIDPEKIAACVSKKVSTQLTPIFEFSTTADLIKRVLSHSFIFGENQKDLRIYLETKSDMENNALFATLGNKENNLNNELTLKLGIVTSGKLDDRNLVVDMNRLNLFNALPSKEIKISLMNMNVLVSKATIVGKNDSWFNLTVYSTILKG